MFWETIALSGEKQRKQINQYTPCVIGVYQTLHKALHVTVKVTLLHANASTNGRWWYGSIPSLTSALWGWVVNATPGPLYSGKESRYPLCWRLGGPQDQHGPIWRDTICCHTGSRTVDHPAHGESLHRLRYSDFHYIHRIIYL
jgi:hypothetical protein